MEPEKSKKKLQCPSNTLKDREMKKTKALKVVENRVKYKKKSFAKQFSELFVGADGGNMSTYIVQDIVIPTIKGIVRDVTEAITDAIKGGIEMQLFGERDERRSSGRKRYDEPRTNYTKYSKSHNDKPRRVSSRAANKHFEDVVVETRREAQDVINKLYQRIDEYGEATVEDLQDLVGITGDFTDSYYGWYNLNNARIRSGRDGYLIDLPKPIYLD